MSAVHHKPLVPTCATGAITLIVSLFPPQGYIVCPSEQRFMLLFTFLKKNLSKKIMVFLSSCNSVRYHAELLNYIDIPVLDIHVSDAGLCGGSFHLHSSWANLILGGGGGGGVVGGHHVV